MKKSFLIALVSLFALSLSHAQLIMSGSLLNGDFETGTGTGGRAFDGAGFVATWYNAGSGNQTATAANNNLAAGPASGYNGVIADTNTGGVVLHSAKTTSTFVSGGTFDISYDWLDAFGWEENDQVRVAVVAFDTNLLGGTEVYRAFVNDKVSTASTWESVLGSTGVTDAAAIGKTIFIQTYAVNGGAGTGDFARIDNITVTQVVPESSTFAFLTAAFSFTFVALRRRLS